MAKKSRSRRHRRKRFRYIVTMLIFSFSTLLFLHTQYPHVLRITRDSVKIALPLPTPSRPEVEKPQTWYHSGSQSQTTKSTSSPTNSGSPTTPDKRSVSISEIPKGPYPLPALNKTSSKTHEGTSWAASLNKRETGNLPLHWIAELSHRPPESARQPTESIFTARRKGAWMGCERETWLICKGAYKAIKKINAVTIVDTGCGDNTKWLPDVIKKLRSEFRLVRLTCIGRRVEGYDEHVKFLDIDPFSDTIPSGMDLLLAFKFVEKGTLISAMKFFKNVKKAGVKYLLTETFPDEENVVKKVDERNLLRFNGAMPPFWFPAPEYEYENSDENNESVAMQIAVSKVIDLFEEKVTPEMAELVDPRKRTVRE